MKRPDLNSKLSIDDFENFYWLKEELVLFCKKNGICSSVGKSEIAERIKIYLSTGKIIRETTKQIFTSKFDWNSSILNLDTIITDNYKNTENVRAFMKKLIGSHFNFSTEFMQWTKLNIGKTLGDAILEWKSIYEFKKTTKIKSEIAPQFEYNTYIRDFLTDNKHLTIKDAIKYWKLKRDIKGSNKYTKEDLRLTENDL